MPAVDLLGLGNSDNLHTDFGKPSVSKLEIMFFTYILKSETAGTFYYGHTKDIQNRVAKHNAGKVRSTKSKRPWIIHYVEEFPTKAEAYQRERFFKSIAGYSFLKDQHII